MLPSARVACPYCGEPLELLVDVSAGDQAYVEDCAVCCRPIAVTVRVGDDGDFAVDVAGEDEA